VKNTKENGETAMKNCSAIGYLVLKTTFFLRRRALPTLFVHVDLIAQMNGLCNHGCNYA